MCEIRTPAVIEALQQAAQKHGIKALAAELNKAPSTLYAELSPWGEPGKAKMGLDDALEIMRLTGDFTPLEIAASAAGYRLEPLAALPDKPTVAEEVADVARELGNLADVYMDKCATPMDAEMAYLRLCGEAAQALARKREELKKEGKSWA